ncbi:MAG: prephenate dehydrogenase/arogenate dehydrogenase family protein [Chloroflexi bacterium]|nr:prephenate dehydrogenase/arogenate dehydrogenase family protein [Chloroflexota bacterium]
MSAEPQITIVGLGHIGGSLGLALQRSAVSMQIVGHDKEPGASAEAKKQQAVERTSWNLISAVEDADIVVLALPLSAIRPTLQAIAPELKSGTVVTDTASTKEVVMAWAEELLPDSVSFIGGDPLVLDRRNEALYNANLFDGRNYALVPTANADPKAVELLTNMVSLVGAKPFFLDAVEHDGLRTAVTHLPAVLSVALLKATTENVAWREMSTMAGQAYDAATRLPAEDAQLLQELFLNNRGHLLRWLDSYLASLGEIRGLLAAGEDSALSETLDALLMTREQWARGLEGELARSLEEGLDEAERFSWGALLGLRPKRRPS